MHSPPIHAYVLLIHAHPTLRIMYMICMDVHIICILTDVDINVYANLKVRIWSPEDYREQ